jgi:hypothetical protein
MSGATVDQAPEQGFFSGISSVISDVSKFITDTTREVTQAGVSMTKSLDENLKPVFEAVGKLGGAISDIGYVAGAVNPKSSKIRKLTQIGEGMKASAEVGKHRTAQTAAAAQRINDAAGNLGQVNIRDLGKRRLDDYWANRVPKDKDDDEKDGKGRGRAVYVNGRLYNYKRGPKLRSRN